MGDIRIKKAKLSKGGTVEVCYIDEDGNEIMLKGRNKCHTDLKDAFAALVPYFADLTEQKESDHIDWCDIQGAENIDLLRKLSVTGVSIGGDESNRIVTMSGNRTLFTSRILNLNAPGVEMESEAFEWSHIDDFDIDLQHLVYEVTEYVVNKKWAVERPSLFDADPDDPFAQSDPTDAVPQIEEHAEHVA